MMQSMYPYTALKPSVARASRDTTLVGPAVACDYLRRTLYDCFGSDLPAQMSSCEYTKIQKICFQQQMSDALWQTHKNKCGETVRPPAQDAFLIIIESDEITAYSDTLLGLIYAAWALTDWCQGGAWHHGAIYCTPKCGFRGLKIYLPAPDDLAYFQEMIDTALSLRCNKIVLEVGGAMEYKRHPEINEGWVEYARFMNESSGKTIRIQEQYDWAKNSIHTQNGGGHFLTQQTVRALVHYCTDRGLEVIPEVPSLSHCDYLLTRHPELAERREDPYPDTYCPSNPASYAILFDVLEEVIAVFAPKMVHIAHDELNSVALCDKCRGKDPAQLLADDIGKIHAFLKQRGIRTMIWSDKLLDAHCVSGYAFGGAAAVKDAFDWHYESIPATWQAIDRIDKDIAVMHWIWTVNRDLDHDLLDRNFTVVFGNLNGPAVPDFERRLAAGIDGGCVSNWSALHPDYICRNGILFNLAFCATVFWGKEYTENQFEQRATEVLNHCLNRQQNHVLAQPHFSVVHTTNYSRSFRFYFDGHMVDRAADTIGHYHLTLSGGNTIDLPVIFGENIGAENNDFSLRPNGEFDQLDFCTSLLELSGHAVPFLQNGKMYYYCVFANPYPDERVIDVAFVPVPAFAGQVELYSCTIEFPDQKENSR